ncbi:MAG: DUF6737 family protein, partial [Leptolyngbyaceae cyanobacterium]
LQGEINMSVWNYKPWWCQPWSIILTGSGLVGSAWWLSHRIWVTLLVATPVTLWMTFFLLVYPRLFQERLLQEQSEQEEFRR